MKIKAVIAVCAFSIMSAAAQGPAPKAAQAKPAAAKPAASAAGTVGAPKFKAIWEPVPFNKDIGLNAIACVGPETCWVVGDKSTILLTTDGGKTWQVQLGGDPEATDDALTKIFFLDAKNGWAMTDRGKILGTRDGSTWAELSTVSGTTKGVWFLSPQTGLEIENPDSTSQSTLRRSDDGGKTWKPLSRCSVEATVGGLPRKLGCMMRTAQFLSPTVGFAGGGAGISMGTDVATFGKTSDGGQTWTMAVVPETKWQITAVKFWTEKDGIVVLSRGEEVYWTADAGGTWTRSVKQRLWPSSYGVGEGKIIVGVGESGGIGYSFNGGRNFTSRPITLPARVHAVTFPDAHHGYLVGQHAMVYRYRIVPIDYTSQGMIGAMAP
ncbi:MAG: YCF48-related protein [Acidobacteriota bacterium]